MKSNPKDSRIIRLIFAAVFALAMASELAAAETNAAQLLVQLPTAYNTPDGAALDLNGKITTWYQFKADDMHPETGRIGPMDAAFGPDGNLYVADMQLFWSGEHKSRLLRINMKNGQAIDMDIVVKGVLGCQVS